MIYSNVESLLGGREPATIASSASVRDACKVMCRLDVRAVAVTDASGLVGVLSERDVISKCVCAERHTAETPVADVMTRPPRTMDASGDLAQALEIMSEGRFHHVPVLRDGAVIGILSSDDIPEEYRMMLERFKEMRGRMPG